MQNAVIVLIDKRQLALEQDVCRLQKEIRYYEGLIDSCHLLIDAYKREQSDLLIAKAKLS